ncbi:MAG: UspA [Frankiales bacterium]|nr:UspA [Frankiales bacterium]
MTHEALVVVGVDGSESSRAAVRWAASEAEARHARLLLVHAWHVEPSTRAARLLLADDERPLEAAVLAEAAEQVRVLAPGVAQDTELTEGRPDEALLTAAAHASLLVLGRGEQGRVRLGSTLGHVSVRSGCPVVAVPAGPGDVVGPVVVGVDGSLLSEDAVAFAFGQAARRGLPLTAVLAIPPSYGVYLPGEPELELVRETGRRHLAEALAGWSERYPEVQVRQVVSLDAPLVALQEAGARASLLVVGSHGRGALLRAALGSVSGSLLRSSTCPLAVVRPPVPAAEPVPAVGNPVPVPLTYL